MNSLFTVFAFLVALVYDVAHGIKNGFDVFDIIVTSLVAVALAVNVLVLLKGRRE